MATDLEYIKEVSGIRYRSNANNMTRLKGKHKGQAKMALDHRAINRI